MNIGYSSQTLDPTTSLPNSTLSSFAQSTTAISPGPSSAASSSTSSISALSHYENQKRCDRNNFGQCLCKHRPLLSLSRCSSAHMLEFLCYLDQFGKTKVHTQLCPFYGHLNPLSPCPCPLRLA